MNKRFFLIIIVLGLSICNVFAQHLDFMGVELGGDPKLIINELVKQGYYRSENKNDPGFYNEDCRILILKEKNSNIYSDLKEVVYGINIEFGYENGYSVEEANAAISQIVETFCESYRNDNKEVYVKNDFMCFGGIGPLIILKSGFIEVYGVWKDSRKSVNVRMYDSPDNYFYYQAKEQNKSNQNKTSSQKNKRKNKRKKK